MAFWRRQTGKPPAVTWAGGLERGRSHSFGIRVEGASPSAQERTSEILAEEELGRTLGLGRARSRKSQRRCVTEKEEIFTSDS